MKIGYLGAGVWGYCLAYALATKGYEVVVWDISSAKVKELNHNREHPRLPGYHAPLNMWFTDDMSDALNGVDLLVEGVTSGGIRPVFEKVKSLGVPDCPIVLTSKGIEQDSCLLMPEVVTNVLGQAYHDQVCCLSGPSIAQEVIRKDPTSLVCAAYNHNIREKVLQAFSTDWIRIYLNRDIRGVAFGGAMKNITALASGISDGLGFGDNTKSLLITRGLHEIRKLSVYIGCNPQTLNGLAGLGDLCVTCLSTHSRNYRFGRLIAEGMKADEAKDAIGMAVEGAYTCLSACQLSQRSQVEMPIAQAIYEIIYNGLEPQRAVKALLSRSHKEEFE
ncbi:MAG: NAD(P)H-dependent glycerol-3-phosphate dehydrogenase [Chlamydiota bacterium]